MGCLLWIWCLVYILLLSSQPCMRYHDKLDRVITALYCIMNVVESFQSKTSCSLKQLNMPRATVTKTSIHLWYIHIYHAMYPSLDLLDTGNDLMGLDTMVYLGLITKTKHWLNFELSKDIPSLHWCHNEHDGVSNHQSHNCLFNCSLRGSLKKTSKFLVTGLCVGNSPVTGEFFAQKASNAENVSISWRHDILYSWVR